MSPRPGRRAKRIKRLAIMDQDGANHRFLTNGQSIVLTPRFAPNQQSIVYMSYVERPARRSTSTTSAPGASGGW